MVCRPGSGVAALLLSRPSIPSLSNLAVGPGSRVPPRLLGPGPRNYNQRCSAVQCSPALTFTRPSRQERPKNMKEKKARQATAMAAQVSGRAQPG